MNLFNDELFLPFQQYTTNGTLICMKKTPQRAIELCADKHETTQENTTALDIVPLKVTKNVYNFINI